MGIVQWISTTSSLCGIAGFGVLAFGYLRRRFRHLDRVAQASASELTPGPGADGPSMRDDVTAILTTIVAQGADIIEVQKGLADLATELKDHVRSPHRSPDDDRSRA